MQIWADSASQVWGVNNAGMIFHLTPGGWEQIPGTMKQIAAAADGTVYGVTPANAVVRWRGGAERRVPARKPLSSRSGSQQAGSTWLQRQRQSTIRIIQVRSRCAGCASTIG